MYTKYIILILIPCLLGFSTTNQRTNTPSEQFVIYLTFDDGPTNGSQNVSDVVLNEKVDVDVFLTGKNVAFSKKNRTIYEQYLSNPFVERCNHSFSRNDLHYKGFYTNPVNVYDDFLLNEYLFDFNNNICRLPGWNTWRIPGMTRCTGKSGRASANMLAVDGYKIFGWDVEWQYNPRTACAVQTPDEMAHIVDSVLSHYRTFTPGHLVILCHDKMFRNSNRKSELTAFIDKLKATGKYRFERLSNYPGLKAPSPYDIDNLIAK